MGVRPKGFIENYKATTASRDLIERISAILVEYAAFLRSRCARYSTGSSGLATATRRPTWPTSASLT